MYKKGEKYMKKTIRNSLAILICAFSLILCSCTRLEDMEEEEIYRWDCDVICEQESTPDSYIITYSNVEFGAETGILTIQNQNDFDIRVHLFTNRKNEKVIDIEPGGATVLHELNKEAEYSMGIHADVDEGTEIKVMVYDGDASKRL